VSKSPAGRRRPICFVGREEQLLETMRDFAHRSEEMIHNTPTATQLKELYERDDSILPGF